MLIILSFLDWCTQELISEYWFASVSKRVFVQNFSCENEFDWHENGRAGETYSVHETRFDTETDQNSGMGYSENIKYC